MAKTPTLKQIAYHRNGVSGLGFWAITFKCSEGHMVASVFPEDGAVSVFNIDALPIVGITFGQNSWRGDVYEPWLREQIAAEERRIDATLQS